MVFNVKNCKKVGFKVKIHCPTNNLAIKLTFFNNILVFEVEKVVKKVGYQVQMSGKCVELSGKKKRKKKF